MLAETLCMRTYGVVFLAITSIGCSQADPATVPMADQTELPVPTSEILPPTNPEPASYPSTEQWSEAGPKQQARAERSFAVLKGHRAPVYDGPLFVADDDDVRLQSPDEVARRAIILWAVALRAEGTPQAEVSELVSNSNAWSSASPSERQFLEDPNPDPRISQSLVWRLESLWVMLWALGKVDRLEWPSEMCNVPRLVEIMRVQESDPAFIAQAELRSVAEILDAQDLTMRIHWAIRDASLREPSRIPQRLDWSGDVEWVSIAQCPGVGVVEERHHALNWLVNFLDPEDWDRVDTPT